MTQCILRAYMHGDSWKLIYGAYQQDIYCTCQNYKPSISSHLIYAMCYVQNSVFFTIL